MCFIKHIYLIYKSSIRLLYNLETKHESAGKLYMYQMQEPITRVEIGSTRFVSRWLGDPSTRDNFSRGPALQP